MKKLKWITIKEYVDEETGEVLNSKQAEKSYIIKRKIKKHDIRKEYHNRELTELGITTITNICTRHGRQQEFEF